jgi:hypothetical protein
VRMPAACDHAVNSLDDDYEQCIECLVDSLRGQLAEAAKDTARIDWIDRNMDCDIAGEGLHVSLVDIDDDQTLREAIDEARLACNACNGRRYDYPDVNQPCPECNGSGLSQPSATQEPTP